MNCQMRLRCAAAAAPPAAVAGVRPEDRDRPQLELQLPGAHVALDDRGQRVAGVLGAEGALQVHELDHGGRGVRVAERRAVLGDAAYSAFTARTPRDRLAGAEAALVVAAALADRDQHAHHGQRRHRGAASRISRRRRVSAAVAAASRASRSARNCSFCSLLLAIVTSLYSCAPVRYGPARCSWPAATCCVTGASGGIGQGDRARAPRARRPRDRERPAHRRARGAAAPSSAARRTVLEADLADRDAVRRRCVERAGPLDALVANAALPASGRVDSFTRRGDRPRARREPARADPDAHAPCSPGMLERGRGHLVFVSSLSGKVSSGGSAIYSATKFGLRGFAAGLREDLHRQRRGRDDRLPGLHLGRRDVRRGGLKLPPGVGTQARPRRSPTPWSRHRGGQGRARRGPARHAGGRAPLGPLADGVGALQRGWDRSRSPTSWPPASAPSASER